MTEQQMDPPRCGAKMSNNQQCTRRPQAGCTVCGTHRKQFEANENKLEVFLHDIDGIASWVDARGNIYKPEHIMSKNPTPEIIGTMSEGASEC